MVFGKFSCLLNKIIPHAQKEAATVLDFGINTNSAPQGGLFSTTSRVSAGKFLCFVALSS